MKENFLNQFIEQKWPLIGGELVPKNGAVLVACDHPPFPGLVPLINSLALIRPDLVLMTDAVLAPPAKFVFGIETIAINACNNVSWAKDFRERWSMQGVRSIGEIAGVYRRDGSQSVKAVLDQALIALEEEKLVMLAPAGQNSKKAEWKSGYGGIVKGMLEKGKNVRLVMATANRGGAYQPVILSSDNLSTFAGEVINKSSHGISRYFQEYFEKKKNYLSYQR